MPKSNADRVREYRARKRAAENKLKKRPKTSTERVRLFRAKQKKLQFISSVEDTGSVGFYVPYIQHTEYNSSDQQYPSLQLPNHVNCYGSKFLKVKEEFSGCEYSQENCSMNSKTVFEGPSETLKLSNHVNNYDSKINMLVQVKEEFSESEYLQDNYSINSKIVFEYPSETLQLPNHVNCYGSKFVQVKEEFSGTEYSQENCSMNSKTVFDGPSETLKLSNHDNNYDSKINMLVQVKEEFSENEYPQDNCSINSKIVFEDPPATLKLSNHVNYYDSKLNMFEQVKEEFSGSECPQADCSMNSKIDAENNGLEFFVDKQNPKNDDNTEKVSLTCIKQENDETMYQIIIKLETPDEIEMSDSAEDTSTHYDVLVTPQEVQCKLCGRVFKNSFNLLKHNNEHIKIKINTLGDNLLKPLQRSQCFKKNLNNNYGALAHVRDVHGKNNFKCEICGKRLNTIQGLKKHILILHKLQKVPKTNHLKCEYCDMYLKNKYYFNNHMKLCHPDKVKEEIKYKCDTCGNEYTTRQAIIYHIKSTHFVYERMLVNDCGKKFRKPVQLANHETRQRNKTYNGEVQCDHCQKTFKYIVNLRQHLRRIHYDYIKVLKCRCGKEFRTPYQLREHKSNCHSGNTNVTLAKDFQCDVCQKLFKNKRYLGLHRRRMHKSHYGIT